MIENEVGHYWRRGRDMDNGRDKRRMMVVAVLAVVVVAVVVTIVDW
jgi:hypothetical protein